MKTSLLLICSVTLLGATTSHSFSLKKAVGDMYTSTTQSITSLFEWSKKEIDSHEFPLNAQGHVQIDNNTGSLSISTWKKNKVMLETNKKGKEKALPNTTISVKTTSKKISISTESLDSNPPLPTDYTLIVPEQASIAVNNASGNITVKDSAGSLDLQTDSGNIIIKNNQGTVKAHTPRGSVNLEQAVLKKQDSIFIESYKTARVALPEHCNANFTGKTVYGTITSTLYITLTPITTQLNTAAWKRMKRSIEGVFGSGGSSIFIDVTKGSIAISEYTGS